MQSRLWNLLFNLKFLTDSSRCGQTQANPDRLYNKRLLAKALPEFAECDCTFPLFHP